MADEHELVPGLDRFRKHFVGYDDQYVLIGGSAAALTMEEAGLQFRTTKDLDIVLHVEALTPQFVSAFWAFVKAGGYAIAQKGEGQRQFYRFEAPATVGYPEMLELFGRRPEGVDLTGAPHLTPIPSDGSVSSLSAIHLLDDDYYAFVIAGRRMEGGLVWVGEDRLIPLKASAWLDMTERLARGDKIDSRKIRKHRNDVLRLSQMLTAATRIDVPKRVADDLRRFLEALLNATDVDLRPLNIRTSASELAARIVGAYGLG